MSRFRRRASRGAFPRRFLLLGLSLFVGVNVYFLLHHSSPAQAVLEEEAAAGVAGEGAHRYRQTEQDEPDARAAAASAAAADSAAAAAAAAADSAAAAAADSAAAAAGGAAAGGTAGAAGAAGGGSTGGAGGGGGGGGGEAGGGGGGGEAGGGTAAECHIERDAEYDGETVVTWGDKNYLDSAAACCAACRAAPNCNVWVYCGQHSGCPVGRLHRECWLKRKKDLDPTAPQGHRSPGSGWISGALYSDDYKAAALQRVAALKSGEQQYLEGLKANESLPMVYLDVEIKGKPVGRIEMVLFTDVSPRAAENFRQLCTGESGSVPNEPGREGAGKARHFKGAFFYRIIDQFIDQTGVETESVFGGQFKDDPGGLKLKHERKGLLSMANMGPNTNTAHFSIMMGPAHHLDGSYTIFGQVVSGFDVVDAINALSKGKQDNTATAADGARIVDSGQIRKGTLVPDLTLGLR